MDGKEKTSNGTKMQSENAAYKVTDKNKNVQDKKESFKINTNRLIEQRPRSTGFRTFLNWFKKVENLQRTVQEESSSLSDSSDDHSSTSSTATVASFSFLPANNYKPYGDASQPEKFITPGPYTETYHRLISERNRRRSMDKNLSLRKKYSLYSSGTLTGKLKSSDENNPADSDDAVKFYDTFSLPTIAKSGNNDLKKYSDSRRTASLSSRDSKTGTSCHVKGKRRAPPPPTTMEFTKSYRKKRQAPKPPSQNANGDSENKILEKKCDGIKLNMSDDSSENIAKKDVRKDVEKVLHIDLEKCVSTVQSELSPKPWYKRQISENKSKSKSNKTDSSRKKSKHEYPEVGFFRCSRIFENKKVTNSDKSEGDLKQEKRASCLLPNISELDREAAEIIKHHKQDVQNNWNQPTEDNVSFVNKPSSARDLINKFNAITNATKNSSSSASAILPWAPEQQKILNSPNQLKKSNEDINDLNSRTNDIEFIDKGKTPEKDMKPGYFNNILYKKNESDNNNTDNLKNEEKFGDKSKHDNIDPLKKEDFSQSFQAAVFSALPDLNYIPTSDKEDTEKVDSEMKQKVIDAQEKKKLRELLKEMKNSLPKKPKPELKKDLAEEVISQVSPIFIKKDTIVGMTGDESKQSAIINSESEITNVKLNKEPSHKETSIIEDVQIKLEAKSGEQCKNGIVNKNLPSNAIKTQNSQQEIYGNSNKVSSSAQTGCMVKRYDQILGPSKKTEVKPVALVTEIKANAVYTNLDESKRNSSIDPVKLFQSDENTRILLKKLESAIAEGDDSMAAKLAKDLAILKVNCSVIGAPHKPTQDTTIKKVQIYIEDQISHQGPIPLRVDEKMTIAELKRRIENELHIPIPVQRWIIGKQLATDDSLQLQHYNGKDFDVPLFLYVVAPEKKAEEKVEIAIEVKKNVNETKEVTKKLVATIDEIKPLNIKIVKSDAGTQNDVKIVEKILSKKYPAPKATTNVVLKDVIKNTWICTACTLINSQLSPLCSACGSKKVNVFDKVEKVESPKPAKKEVKNHYLQLVNLDGGDLAPNVEQFECPICFTDCPPQAGVLLRDCLHSFCKECLANTVKYSEEAEIKCPFRDKNYYCDSVIQEREIKALVNKAVYEQHLAKSVAFAENKMKNTFHCKSPDCKGWCIFEENVNDFRCPVCKKINCLTCQAIHEGKNCKEYQDFLVSEEASTSNEGQQTKAMLDEMVSRGEALVCPSCNVILMKKWGCDWLRCSMCKTEICWVTRGPRWGPAGKGDNSGGCQCGVNGVKCHPKCNYCH